MESFVAGFAYGITTVIVGQPLDTVKTRVQTAFGKQATSSFQVAKDIFAKEGIVGLYRGGAPLLLGGGFMRSAQFGCYNSMLSLIKKQTNGESNKVGFLDLHVVLAGFAGGLGRGLVEGPVEFIKVRKQLDHSWKYSELMKGFGATLIRNSFLFSSFVIYMDFNKQWLGDSLGPFLSGAICSSLAWLTVWPLDVAKSRLQSGDFAGKPFRVLLLDVFASGTMFRGLLPGLARSAVANGCSMVVYKKVEQYLLMRREDSI